MKNLTVLILVVVAVLVISGVLKWRQIRRANLRQALLQQAEQASAGLEALAEKEYGQLGTTAEEIFSHEDSKILGALNYRIGKKPETRVTETERRLVAVYWLDGEVHNGGFDQYFFNTAGNDAEAALAALKEMGAAGAASLLDRAMGVFPEGKPPADRQKRQQAMDKVRVQSKSVWNQCDNEFYKLKEDLGQLTLAYAKRKKAEIVLP
ncbi:MAG TPA: DUF4375 domain-containing protein [Clostridia bacterium]|nr:DUF4375 domain-containing protein [Clostridia bacterium]